MPTDIQVGEITVTALVDGTFVAGPEYFGIESFAGHEQFLDAEGKMRLPIGCFLLRGGKANKTVLIDAGLGTISLGWLEGGNLMKELEASGVRAEDVDHVVCSHLHIDHCGWLFDSEGRANFANASFSVGAADWHYFVEEQQGFMGDEVRAGLRDLSNRGDVRLLSSDEEVLPGLSTLAAPGHTPGHNVLVVSSGSERALLLGDSVTCPMQLNELDWNAISDVDPKLAAQTRQRMWDELEGSSDIAVGAHFPGLEFGRVLAGANGRRWL